MPRKGLRSFRGEPEDDVSEQEDEMPRFVSDESANQGGPDHVQHNPGDLNASIDADIADANENRVRIGETVNPAFQNSCPRVSLIVS